MFQERVVKTDLVRITTRHKLLRKLPLPTPHKIIYFDSSFQCRDLHGFIFPPKRLA